MNFRLLVVFCLLFISFHHLLIANDQYFPEANSFFESSAIEEKGGGSGCDTVVAPYTQSFDSGTTTPSCWINGATGRSWTINSLTPTSSTGPKSGDHTTGSGNFAFTESSGYYNTLHDLTTPVVDLAVTGKSILYFWYHMYGSNMGNMSVAVKDVSSGITYNNVWKSSGDRGNIWRLAQIPLLNYGRFVQVTFKGTTGSGTLSDMAIDDIAFDTMPDCTPPFHVSLIAAHASSLEITWQSNKNQTSWNIEYGLKGFTKGSGTRLNGITNDTTTIDHLLPYTNYDIYIQSGCDTTLSANWSNCYTFRTTDESGHYFLTDSLALVALYRATNGAGWTTKTNWLTGPVKSWYGITLTDDRVTKLSLNTNNLVGYLPDDICNLTALTELIIPSNSLLTSNIPDSIGNLSKLTGIYLYSCDFTGEIPASFWNLTNLKSIDLSFNDMLGGPISPAIGNLTKLTYIRLARCKLTGIVPAELSNLTGLTTLELRENPFYTQPIPDVSPLVKLTELDISNCNFTGSFPTSILNMTNLVVLYFSGNSLTPAPIPDFSKMTSLKVIEGAQCNFTGTLPVSLMGMTQLTTLDFTGNHLSGTLPATIGNLINLYELSLGNNDLSGALPTQLGSLTKLQTLSLNNNKFSGQIPGEIGNMINLYYLHLNENQFSGAIPATFSKLSKLNQCYLHKNKLTGNLPTALAAPSGENRSEMKAEDESIEPVSPERGNEIVGTKESISNVFKVSKELKIENNKFTYSNLKASGLLPGSVPTFTYAPQDTTFGLEYTNGTNLLTIQDDKAIGNSYQWYYNGETMTGKTNDTITSIQPTGGYYCKVKNSTYPELEYLSNTYGTISYSLASDSVALVALYNSTGGSNWTNKSNWLTNRVSYWYGITVSGNRVTGINLYLNNMVGRIPFEIGNLTALKSLKLRSNYGLKGQLPRSIGNLKSIEIIDLYNNNYWGFLPDEIGQLTTLKYLNLGATWTLTGQIPDELGNLVNLRYLSLRNNLFEGKIPKPLLTLPNLTFLDLSYNDFAQDSMPDFRGLININSLKISGCSFTGDIPASLLEMNWIDTLEVSNNQYTCGNIPDFSSLTSLKSLWLDQCCFKGTIPASLLNMSHITDLWLSNNQFTPGPLPNFNNMTSLTTLLANNCNFTGPIPGSFFSHPSLKSLQLHTNQLSGSLPAEIGNMKQLIVFILYDNHLSGSLPNEICNLPNLSTLALNNNELSGSLPAEFGNLTQLWALELQNNHFSGALPLSMGNLPRLSYCYLNNNMFSENIPSNFKQSFQSMEATPIPEQRQLSEHYYFDKDGVLVQNTTDPTIKEALPKLYRFEIQSNKFTFANMANSGVTPSNVSGFVYTPQDTVLGIRFLTQFNALTVNDGSAPNSNYQWYLNNVLIPGANNDTLTLTVPSGDFRCVITNTVYNKLQLGTLTFNEFFKNDSLALVELYRSTGGTSWTNHTNWLTGPLNTWYGVTITDNRVVQLLLPDNNLSGTIPAAIGNLTWLNELNFENNHFTGSIPSTIFYLTQLQKLNLGHNQISNQIPLEVKQMVNLQTLELNNNQLTGFIPPGFGKLLSLKVLCLDSNQLSGPIPSELGDLSSLEELILNNNQLSDSIPDEFGRLLSLKILSLDSNQLTGSIPYELGYLTNLKELKLGNNQLSGSIPVEIGNLISLQQLNLHHNYLSGNLPSGIGKIAGLSELTVQNNTFTFSDLDSSGVDPEGIVHFLYDPQYTIYPIALNGDSIIALDCKEQHNRFEWFKDGFEIADTTRTIPTQGDGSYWYRVTNTKFPGLTILSDTLVYEIKILPDLQIEGESLASGEIKCYNATQTISVAGNGKTVEFLSGSSATLIAGQSIRFLEGFHAESGSFMNAYITSDNTFCDGVEGGSIVEQPLEKSFVNELPPVEPGKASKLNYVKVYPNPSNGKFIIEFANIDMESKLVIYNSLGSKIYQTESRGTSRMELNLQGIRKGIYFLKVINDYDQFVQKIIID